METTIRNEIIKIVISFICFLLLLSLFFHPMRVSAEARNSGSVSNLGEVEFYYEEDGIEESVTQEKQKLVLPKTGEIVNGSLFFLGVVIFIGGMTVCKRKSFKE